MSKLSRPPKIARPQFDHLADDVAMAIWNHIAELPGFHHLEPRDFPGLYEAIHRALRPYYARLANKRLIC